MSPAGAGCLHKPCYSLVCWLSGTSVLRKRLVFGQVSQVDTLPFHVKDAAYPKAFNSLKAEGLMPDPCELRQSKYLNNLVDAATIASSNDLSNLGWASFRSRPPGAPVPGI